MWPAGRNASRAQSASMRSSSRALSAWIRVAASGRLKAQSFRTSEYPAFPTDMQAQFMALDCVA